MAEFELIQFANILSGLIDFAFVHLLSTAEIMKYMVIGRFLVSSKINFLNKVETKIYDHEKHKIIIEN